MSITSAIRRRSKIASTHVIRHGILKLMSVLTSSSPNLASTQDEVLIALAKDVEIHICNDGFWRGVEMYFASLVRQSTLAFKLANIESNAEAHVTLNVVEAKRKTLMKELD